jgi:hypothetical protein
MDPTPAQPRLPQSIGLFAALAQPRLLPIGGVMHMLAEISSQTIEVQHLGVATVPFEQAPQHLASQCSEPVTFLSLLFLHAAMRQQQLERPTPL